jgi:hypothetical protein
MAAFLGPTGRPVAVLLKPNPAIDGWPVARAYRNPKSPRAESGDLMDNATKRVGEQERTSASFKSRPSTRHAASCPSGTMDSLSATYRRWRPAHPDQMSEMIGLQSGNHARFLFDFAPEAIVLRWTTDPAPRIMFCFEQSETGQLSLAKLLARVRGKDVDPKKELIVLGTAEKVEGLTELAAEGVKVYPGVKAASAAVIGRVREDIQD